MSQHRGFQQVPQDVALLRRLAPTLAGFQPGTSRTPNVHLTTQPYRTRVFTVHYYYYLSKYSTSTFDSASPLHSSDVAPGRVGQRSSLFLDMILFRILN